MTTPGDLSRPSGGWVHDHLLSVVLFVAFLVSWAGQLYYQYLHELDQARLEGNPLPAGAFAHSFLASTLENWQSEFLQLLTFVVLATYVIHRGSPQSRDGSDQVQEDVAAIRRHLGA